MTRKAFLLRIDPKLLDAVQRWADDDLRSLNAQIEFLLRRVLREAGRLKEGGDQGSAIGDQGSGARTARSEDCD
jgi:hypothetical protein